jgi:hypothetical protein
MKLASATWLGPPLLTLQGPDFGRACADLMRLVEVDYAPTLIIGIRTGGLVVAQAMADAASPRLPVLPLTCRRVTTAAKSRLPLLRTLLGILPRPVVNQLRRRGLVVFVSDLLLDRDLALKALRFLGHRGHQVLVLHLMDPAEVALGGPAEARFEDPETRAAVVLRPRDWAGAYRDTVRTVVHEWALACRRHGIRYHRVTTDTPYGIVLREALAPSPRAA